VRELIRRRQELVEELDLNEFLYKITMKELATSQQIIAMDVQGFMKDRLYQRHLD
jgi:hypothetical protein